MTDRPAERAREGSGPERVARTSTRRLERQRWSLIGSVLVVLVALALTVALLLEAARDVLPQVPGLNYGLIQGGLVAVALAFSAYAVERERRLRHLEEELEEERTQGERLRAMDDVKNAFLRTISHDLRSPLTVILGMSVLLEGRGEELPAEKLRDAAQSIGVQARRLDSMLTDLLDVERVVRGIVRLQAEETDVAELVRGVVEGLALREHPVELPEGPVRARVDGVLVGRIVDNLVRNAVKYTPSGTPIEVGIAKEGFRISLSVEDAGPGVPDEHKEGIFELFERGAPPAGAGGTGIGLSLVRQFAELHGGRAWVEDRPGGGAAFRIDLEEAVKAEASEAAGGSAV